MQCCNITIMPFQYLGKFSGLVIFLAFLDIGFAIATGKNTYLNNGVLSNSFRLYTLIYVFLGWALVAFGLISVQRTWDFFLNILTKRNVRCKCCRAAPFFACTAIIGLLTVAAWGHYDATGYFPGYDSVRFATDNLKQILRHMSQMEGWKPLIIIIFILILMIITTVGIPGVTRHLDKKRFTWLFSVSVLTIALIFLVLMGIDQYSSRQRKLIYMTLDGTPCSAQAVYQVYFAHKSSPLINVFYTAIDSFDFSADKRHDVLTKADLEPIVQMRTYLDTIQPETITPLNVIFIIIESLRIDRISCLGAERTVMPNLDRLCEEATVFSHCYTQSSHSNYADLCPLSSLYPLRTRNPYNYRAKSPYPKVLIYDILHGLGYQTAIISSQDETWGNMNRFLETPGLDYFAHAGTHTGTLYYQGETADQNANTGVGKIDDRETVSHALKWIFSQNRNPFFLYMNLQRSHYPYTIPREAPRPFQPCRIDFKTRFAAYPKEKTNIMRNAYDNSLHYVDMQLGLFFDELKKRGQYETSLIVVTGDTGQAFYEHGVACHGNMLYDEVMRVPLIMRIPGKESRIIDALVQHVDVPPTICDALGIPPHPIFQGCSALRNLEVDERCVFSTTQIGPFRVNAVIYDSLKLMVDDSLPLRKTYLFNLRNDPQEKNNLVLDKPRLTQRVAKLLDYHIVTQLEYYRRPELYRHYYPPESIVLGRNQR